MTVFRRVPVATFILDASFSSGGKSQRVKDRSTLVFVKDKGAWKIVHEHFSRIL
jgi:ketosteroid isomerase-like protein